MRRNPLARSYRVDKLTLAALEATLTLYRDPALALREIPTLALLGAPLADVRDRAERARVMLHDAGVDSELIASVGSVGAGAFPTAQLPGAALALRGNAERWSTALRAGTPAVVGRVHDGRVLLDFRAISDGEVDVLVNAVKAAHD
ncbi:MAG: L-seryl-tRNA(Sec) selenium transferase, partial [bacterium]